MRSPSRTRRIASRVALVLLSGLVVAGSGPTQLASAVPPTREPLALPTEPFLFTDTRGGNPCSFPVLLHVTTNKQVVTSFTRRNGVTSVHTTGALKVTLTNEATGESLARNISGPIFTSEQSDGSILQKGAGPALWVLDPGVAPELPRLVILKGKSVSVIGPERGAFRFLSRQGPAEDLCAALA